MVANWENINQMMIKLNNVVQTATQLVNIVLVLVIMTAIVVLLAFILREYNVNNVIKIAKSAQNFLIFVQSVKMDGFFQDTSVQKMNVLLVNILILQPINVKIVILNARNAHLILFVQNVMKYNLLSKELIVLPLVNQDT